MQRSVLVGFGANLTSLCYGAPIDTCRWAIKQVISMSGAVITSISSFYRTAPVPISCQPHYINAVIKITAAIDPGAFLQDLHRIEADAGRVRGEVNAARSLDLDLLAVDDLIVARPDLVLPHPRLAERAFVLFPLCDVAPEWRHPQLGKTAAELRTLLPPQPIERLPDTPEDLLLRAQALI